MRLPLVHAHGHAEEVVEDAFEALGAVHRAPEDAGRREARAVRYRVAPEQRALPVAGQRSDPAAERIVVGTIEAHRRLRLGPGTVQQRQQAVVEHVQEAHQRAIRGHAPRTLARVLGHVQRQRAVGAEQAEEALRQRGRRVPVGRREARQRRGGERQRRHLREADRVVAQPQRRAHARQARMRVLEQSHRHEEVELVRLLAQAPQQFLARLVARGLRGLLLRQQLGHRRGVAADLALERVERVEDVADGQDARAIRIVFPADGRVVDHFRAPSARRCAAATS